MSMRPVTQRLSSATFSPWIPINRYSSSFGVGLGVKLSSGANLTYSVQHTFDYFYNQRTDLSIARVTTTATVTMTNHGLSVGDWIQVNNSGSTALDGTFAVATVTNADVFTYTVADSGAAASGGNTSIQTARVFNHADLAGETASGDGNYEFPPQAVRFIITSYTGGFADLTVISGGQ